MQKKKLFIAGIFLLLFFSNTFIYDRFMNAWEIPATEESKIPYCEVAVLLTGMSTYDPQIRRVEFNDRSDRLLQAMHLFSIHKINKILLCGGGSSMTGNDTSEFILLKNFMVTNGIPDSAILIEAHSRNTHENAVFAKSILQKYSYSSRPLLITSASHMRRAEACFAKENILVIPYSTDRYSGPVKYEFDYLFLPSAQTLFNWEKLLHECAGMVVYKIAGYA